MTAAASARTTRRRADATRGGSDAVAAPVTDEATTLELPRLLDQRHADGSERHAALIGSGAWHGPFHGPRRGQGLDFDDLRPYAAGDDVRHVDWKTSARRAALHTRLYREEKEHVVTIALDLRSSMYTGSTTLRAVEAGLLAARLLWRASAGGSRTSVAALHESALSLSRPASGERGALSGCRVIADTFALGRRAAETNRANRTNRTSGTSGTNRTGRVDGHALDPSPSGLLGAARKSSDAPPATLQGLLETLLAGGRSLGRTVVVTGLDAPGDAFGEALTRLATARPLAVVHIEDPVERAGLPPGRYRYATAEGHRTVRIGRDGSRRLGAALASRRDALLDSFAAAGVPLLSSDGGTRDVLATLGHEGFLP